MFQPSTKYVVALDHALILTNEPGQKYSLEEIQIRLTVARKACKDEIGKITHFTCKTFIDHGEKFCNAFKFFLVTV